MKEVPLFTNQHNIIIDNNGYLVIDNEIVTNQNNTPLLAKNITAQGGCEFIKLEDGRYLLKEKSLIDQYENIDQRDSNEIFISLDKVIYRSESFSLTP